MILTAFEGLQLLMTSDNILLTTPKWSFPFKYLFVSLCFAKQLNHISLLDDLFLSLCIISYFHQSHFVSGHFESTCFLHVILIVCLILLTIHIAALIKPYTHSILGRCDNASRSRPVHTRRQVLPICALV